MTALASCMPSNPAHIVLFSGGTAMTASARILKQYTKHSCHFLSPFDSGGSSAEFRRHFQLPALGDLRSRLIALADEKSELHSARALCLSQRLEAGAKPPMETLRQWQSQAQDLHNGEPAWANLFEATVAFARRLPADFHWGKTSLGNLALAAGMVEAGMSLSQVTQQMHSLLHCRGQAHCIVADSLQLQVRLASGRQVLGQHRITGKQEPPLQEAISEIFLCDNAHPDKPVSCTLQAPERALIEQARLIVFCPGSFYTSLLAQMLPEGVSEALANSPAHKVYVPNLGHDPELIGCHPQQALQRLRAHLRPQLDRHTATAELHSVLIDPSQRSAFAQQSDIELEIAPLASPDGTAHQPEKLVNALLALAQSRGISAL